MLLFCKGSVFHMFVTEHLVHVYMYKLFVPYECMHLYIIHNLCKQQILLSCYCFIVYFTAPTCFNQTGCEDAVGNHSLSFLECCFELFAVSYASPGQCLLCPKPGKI